MSPKKVLTNKLFYKKYPYRITCNIQGCWIIRSYGWDKAKEFSLTGHWKYSNWKPNMDPVNLYKFIDAVQPLQSQIKFRFEHDYFDCYLETENQYKIFQEILEQWVVGLSEPESQDTLDFLLEENQ